MRHEQFLINGEHLTWEASRGEVFFTVTTLDESRVIRFVWSAEDLAPMLQAALRTKWANDLRPRTWAVPSWLRSPPMYEHVPSEEGVLGNALGRYMERVDAEAAG